MVLKVNIHSYDLEFAKMLTFDLRKHTRFSVLLKITPALKTRRFCFAKDEIQLVDAAHELGHLNTIN
jgi:hypothetical protein